MAQICAMLAGVTAAMQKMQEGMENEIKNNTKGIKEEMKEMRGEMRQVGQCLQAGKMATPRVVTNELEGSAPAGEDRVIRETCWARVVTEEVTVTEGKSKWGD